MAESPDAEFAPARDELSARERIREAAIDLILAHGYGAPTVEMVVDRAGVSRAEFHSHFADLEDCCLQIYIENLSDFEEVVFGGFERPGAWRDRLRAAVYALARFLSERRREVRFDVVAMSSAGTLPQVHRERQLQRLVDIIDLGRQELDDPGSLSRATAEGVIGSIYALVVGEVQGGRADGAVEGVVPDVMYVAVRPYLGHDAAMEEFRIPPPPEESKGG